MADGNDQVLLTIGLVFISIAAAFYLFGPLPQAVRLPSWLQGQVDLGFRAFPAYRLTTPTIHGWATSLLPYLEQDNLYRLYHWDANWYAGHHLLGYSVLFPPLGAALGVRSSWAATPTRKVQGDQT